MVEKSKSPDISGLYLELSKYHSTGDFEKALKICHKILNEEGGAGNDATAFHCKIVCLLQLGRFGEALRQLEDHESKYDVDNLLAFEKSYALYRENRAQEALKVLTSAAQYKKGGFNLKFKELEAQILYKCEKYPESFSVYRDIMKNTSSSDFDSERLTNMSAVSVHLPEQQNIPTSVETYEQLYNSACSLLTDGKWLEAENTLKSAEKIAEKFCLEDEDAEQEDVDKECGIIRVQLGFALQMQGKEKEAQILYNNVLKSKPSDIGLVAVASNNLMTINKDQNIFDSKKRIKAATAEGLENKLTVRSRREIAVNNALLAMYTNQVENCRELVNEVAEKFDMEKDEQDLIVAGVLARSGKTNEAVDLLINKGKPDLEKILIASQVLLENKDINGAIQLMESKLPKESRFRTGVLSSLVTLYLSADRRQDAAALLKSAVEYNNKNKTDQDMGVVWRKTAEFHLKGGEPTVAAASLEELLKTNPKDRSTLAQLVLAYAKFDLKKALEVSKKLPEFTEKSVDVDLLESSAFLGGGKKTPKAGGMASPKQIQEEFSEKKKKKKKRKKKLPKNFNPNVEPDPERWVPRKERVGYRKPKRDRRNKTEKFTGAQGTSQGQSDAFDYSSKKASAGTPKSPVQPQPQQGPRHQHKKGGGGKGKKGNKKKF